MVRTLGRATQRRYTHYAQLPEFPCQFGGLHNKMARDCYSKYSQDKRFSGKKIITPTDNYLIGGWKSINYEGPAYYVPSERRWIQYDQYKHLPNEARRDAIEFQEEHKYVDFVRHRDAPRGDLLNPGGIGHSGVPELKLFGYTRDPNVYPRHTQFQAPARFPQWDGPGYYGYYHENLTAHDHGLYRYLPGIRRYPGYPLVSHTQGN